MHAPRKVRKWLRKVGLGILVAFVLIVALLIVSQLRQGHPPYVDPETVTLEPRVDAWVERQENGDLAIHWQAGAGSVQVYGGTSPAAIDTSAPLARSDGEKEILISGLDPEVRTYFQLAFDGGELDGERVIVAERFVPLKGASNFRDLGGYRTVDGRRVRWGQVYRSGDLSTLADRDLAYLSSMGLKLVCDLRQSEDTEEAPDRLPDSPGLQYQHVPMFSAEDVPLTRRDLLFNRHLLAEKADQSNRAMIDDKTEVIAGIFHRLADRDSLPAVLHCSSGTARTGIPVALLLLALGVPEDTVIAEYTMSNANYDERFVQLQEKVRFLSILGVKPNDLQPMLIAHPETMRSALDHIRQEYGSIETYLSKAVGPETIAALQDNLLD